MIHLTSRPRGFDTTPRISHLKEEVAMTRQIPHPREKRTTKTDDTTLHRLPLRERATRAHPPGFRGSTIKVRRHSSSCVCKFPYDELRRFHLYLLFQNPHIEKRQNLLQRVTFRLPGDEPEKIQTLTSHLHADVLTGDREAVDLTQTCLHHEGHAHLMDR